MTNHYFQNGYGIGDRNEQDLMQQLNNEIIQIAGMDFAYIPRTIVKLDELYREDYLSTFTKNFIIEMYPENYDEFLGNGELIGKFGFQVEDQMKLIVSRERFLIVTGKVLPSEGDLIYMPISGHLFEIKFVDDKKPIFPLGSRYYITLTCEQFKYSHETFDSGTSVDDIMSQIRNDGATGIGATGPLDPFTKNKEIKDMGNNILDFTENNPFSGY